MYTKEENFEELVMNLLPDPPAHEPDPEEKDKDRDDDDK